jgi:hypothetical protein
MTLKEMVKDKTVKFVCYRDGELTYRTEDGFEFPVPISDTGTGTFLAEDKAILFMRWIRKQLDLVKEWKSEAEKEEEAYWTPDEPMSPELAAANRKLFNSILRARIPEEAVLRFTEEDMENLP